MAGKKISRKVQLATERYLASLGCSREELTERQWEAAARAVKGLKTAKVAIGALLVFAVVYVCVSFYALNLGKRALSSAVPEGTTEIVFVSESGEQSRPESAGFMAFYLQATARLFFMYGMVVALAVAFGFAAIVSIFARREKRKLLEGLLGREISP